MSRHRGGRPPLRGETSIRTHADSVTEFVNENNLNGVAAVGSSMGARLVLELSRRGGVLGLVVSLDPGGFWIGWGRRDRVCLPSQAELALETSPTRDFIGSSTADISRTGIDLTRPSG